MGGNRLGTEVASGVLIKVEEVFSPDLNEGVSILGSVSWVNAEDPCWLVVAIGHGVGRVREVPNEGHRERNDLC